MPPRYARARQPRRATYDEAVIHAILDRAMVAHVGFIADGRPMVMPMAFARVGATLYLHGASKTRIALLDEAPVCLEVTRLTGLVAARSGLHHSVNYESAVIHGTARRVSGTEKTSALDAILDHLLPGRSGEVRPMNAQEDKATGVVAITIEHASAKIRSGPPADEIADQTLPIWAGVVPVVTALGQGVCDAFTADESPEPPSLDAARRKFA